MAKKKKTAKWLAPNKTKKNDNNKNNKNKMDCKRTWKLMQYINQSINETSWGIAQTLLVLKATLGVCIDEGPQITQDLS